MQEKFGYKKEGVRRQKYIPLSTGKITDEVVTGLLKDEWIHLRANMNKELLKNIVLDIIKEL